LAWFSAISGTLDLLQIVIKEQTANRPFGDGHTPDCAELRNIIAMRVECLWWRPLAGCDEKKRWAGRRL